MCFTCAGRPSLRFVRNSRCPSGRGSPTPVLTHDNALQVPRPVFELTSLVRLDLSHNELTVLPPAVGSLTRLEELWLNDNPLTSLPAELGACGQLAQLLLDATCVTKLPRELGRLPKLVEITLEGTPLRPDLRTVYSRGGTLGLLAHLRHKDARRDLKAALREVLTLDVYHEAGLSADGKAAIDAIVRAVAAEFTDFGEFRLLIRNAARLFPPVLASFDVAEVRARQAALVRDNKRKQLSADCELKLRALYYDRIDVTRVEGVVHSISAAIPTLDDMEFLLQVRTRGARRRWLCFDARTPSSPSPCSTRGLCSHRAGRTSTVPPSSQRCR